MKEINKIYNQNCLSGLKEMADNSVDCCVTSPPYFNLRKYENADQIGLEKTPELFIAALVEIFIEVKRVLKPSGVLWLNLGDSYAGSGLKGYKQKDLIGVPWMAAFALRSSGWYLRQDCIWSKPNPMPESVTDRCTKSHEYLFLLSKSSTYYFDADAIKTPVKDSTVQRMMQQIEDQKGSERVPGKTNGTMKAVGPGRIPRKDINNRGGNQASPTGIKAYAHRGTGDKKLTGHSGNFDKEGNLIGDGMANKKSVWTVTTKGFDEAHFATFPEDLIIDMIKAGCPEGGVVLDPFSGAATTAVVAKKLGRNYIGFDTSAAYVKMGNKRLYKEIGMFL